MRSIARINQHNQIIPDINKQSCRDLGNERIFFNVHKIYVELESFTFESTMGIKCGAVFILEIVQALQARYDLKDNIFDSGTLHEIITTLYSDSINSLQGYLDHSIKVAKRGMPNITVTTKVLDDYLLSPNYKDLHKSFFFE